MNAKYMAVFAAAIMLAGCTVLLVNADGADVDADSTVKKTVYVIKDQTVDLKISTTESALGGDYVNIVFWDVSGDKSNPTMMTSGTDTIAEVYVSGSNGEYVLHFKGKTVGSLLNFEITYEVDTKVINGDSTVLKQTITYYIDIHVLPSSFEADLETMGSSQVNANNHEAVEGGIDITYTFEGIDNLNKADYYFYATGLPEGLAMNTNGKIYGTPNIDDSEFVNNPTKSYTVTIVATHVASNIAITENVELIVAGSPYSFSYVVNGSAIQITDGVYKVIRGQEFNIATDTGKYDTDHESIDKVIVIGTESGSTKQIEVTPSEPGVYVFTDETLGTGSYTIQMINGDQQKSFRVIIVEPLADVDASIGFAPGISHWYDTTA